MKKNRMILRFMIKGDEMIINELNLFTNDVLNHRPKGYLSSFRNVIN